MENPSFFLEGIVREKNDVQDFEGPMNLILQLLSKNKIEIQDISISVILVQYMEYLAQMQSMDLEIASEFVQMAAHLLYIKTKTLLTGEEEVSELEVLITSLEQLRARDTLASVRKVLPELKKASEVGMLFYARQPEQLRGEKREYEYRHEPGDLLKAMLRIYLRGGRNAPPDFSESVPKRVIYSVKEKSLQILLKLKKGAVDLRTLYSGCRSRSEVVATFISILELCSIGSILVEHHREDYRIRFIGGDVDEIMEKIVE